MVSTRRINRALETTVLYVVLLVLLVLLVFPVVAIVAPAFKSETEILTFAPNPLPRQPTLENFVTKVFRNDRFIRYLLNSVKVSTAVTLLSVAFATLGGYSLARFRYPGRRILGQVILLTYMFPGSLLVVPLFLTLYRLRLIDTHYALIISYTTFMLPFCVWMLRGFFETLPAEIEDAAQVDGCGRISLFLKIILPLSGPGVAAVGGFAFVKSWSEYTFAITFINADAKRTVAAGLQLVRAELGTDWGLLLAGSVVAMVPVILFYLLLQRFLVAGLTAGAVKGGG